MNIQNNYHMFERNFINNKIQKFLKKITLLKVHLNYDLKKKRLKEINILLKNHNIWKQFNLAQNLNKERSILESIIINIDQVNHNLKYLNDFLCSISHDDQEVFPDINKELDYNAKKIKKLEFQKMFSKINDNTNCYLDIQSGSGGIEAQDWSGILLRMYLRWIESHKFKVEIINELPGDITGIKSITMRIIGNFAYGWLRTETGIHRLVRKSPFDSGGRRHTSFSSVFVYPEINDENINVSINPADIRIDVYRSSGAGGQHVNKTESAVRIIHLPTNITTQCQSERSQHKNKNRALKQLKAKLYAFNLKKIKSEKLILENKKLNISWGNQIRSYILDHSQIKDLRTNIETHNVQAILNGDLDKFIKASLQAGL